MYYYWRAGWHYTRPMQEPDPAALNKRHEPVLGAHAQSNTQPPSRGPRQERSLTTAAALSPLVQRPSLRNLDLMSISGPGGVGSVPPRSPAAPPGSIPPPGGNGPSDDQKLVNEVLSAIRLGDLVEYLRGVTDARLLRIDDLAARGAIGASGPLLRLAIEAEKDRRGL